MLCVACAVLASAQPASSPAVPASFDLTTANGLMLGLRRGDAQTQAAAREALAKADARLLGDILRTATTRRAREVALNVAVLAGPTAFDAFYALLDDRDVGVMAGSALFRVATEAQAAKIPALVACAQGKPAVKNYCAQTIVKVSGPAAAAQTPALREALASADPDLRAHAALALARVGPKAAAAVPDLLAALSDREAAVRACAAEALGRLGGGAKTVAALRAALTDPAPTVREEARASLRRLGA